MSVDEVDRLRHLIEGRRLPGFLGAAGVDGLGTVHYVSSVLCERLGVGPDEVLGRPFLDFVGDDAAQAVESFGGTVARSGHHQMMEFQMRLPSGDRFPVDVVAENCLEEIDLGLVLLHLGDPADRRRSVHLLRHQSAVVRKIALSATLEEATDEILRFVEAAMPGFRAAAYFDDDRRSGRATAAPSLPTAITDRVAAAIETSNDLPGSHALQFQQTVVAADLDDERWAAARRLVGDGVGSVWSVPIRHDQHSEMVGCLEIYGPDAAHPGAEDWSLLRLASGLAAVAHRPGADAGATGPRRRHRPADRHAQPAGPRLDAGRDHRRAAGAAPPGGVLRRPRSSQGRQRRARPRSGRSRHPGRRAAS